MKRLTSGGWLFLCSAIYLIAATIDLFVYNFCRIEYMQIAWVVVMSLPLIIPMQKIVDVKPLWNFKILCIIIAPFYIGLWCLMHPREVWEQAKKEFWS